MRRWRSAAVAAAAVALVAQPTTAGADGGDSGDGGADDTVVSIAEGLQGPRQLNEYRHNKLVVAESDSAEVSSVDLDSGAVEALITFGSAEAPANPHGVDYADGRLYVALGEIGGGPEAGPPPPVQLPPAGTPVPRCTKASTAPVATALVVAEPQGSVVEACDLLQYELVVNPDGQTQVDANSVPVDSLSNPYSVLVQSGRILVADAGANSVLSIDRDNGKISTFFVPPVVTDGACAGVENNPASDKYPATVGCDPVPTGVTKGPDGRIYVSTLGGLTPGAGRVYVLTSGGKEVRRIEGLNPMTGVSVDSEGVVYVSELTGDTPIDMVDPTQPPAGRIVRIDKHDNRTYDPVGFPQGLEFGNGKLYASALSLIPDTGQVVRVGLGGFDDPA
jgi:hypothetical protein